ncbi:MAG: DUF1080 domain-containing protein [Chitinophagaceae bacterium]|nr:DUF1080 domain-containing protein [Chitinophagaceae bacterium]
MKKNSAILSTLKIIAVALTAFVSQSSPAQIPPGFKSIFNGKDLRGWHISRTTHQGTTPDFKVENGSMVVAQKPYGQGGVLLTNKKYKNFEVYLEIKVDSFTNGGIFIRSSESGIAYQVELDETSGSTGNLLGERLQISKGAICGGRAVIWKENDWNSYRIRMVGEIPHITLWINGVEMWDVKQPTNDFIAGATQGMIGLQSHWTALYSPATGEWNGLTLWAPGATHSYRNIAIRVLADDLKN